MEETATHAGATKPQEVRRAAWPLRASGWLFRFVMKIAVVLLFIGIGLFCGGFLKFSSVVLDMKPSANEEPVDAVVVLTGGSLRITEGLELVRDGKGKRLLISGVNGSITMASLKSAYPGFDSVFDCCVDIETVAQNTKGNAEETAKWARESGHSSLIMVTSNYHMPRSLYEFRQALPDVRILAHPVRWEKLDRADWWKETETVRIVLSEYLKYLGAHVRSVLSPEREAALQGFIGKG